MLYEDLLHPKPDSKPSLNYLSEKITLNLLDRQIFLFKF